MDYQTNLDTVLDAILEAKNYAPIKSRRVILDLKGNADLAGIEEEIIYQLLDKLEQDYEVLKAKVNKRKKIVEIILLDNFEDWYKNYLLRKKEDIKNLEYLNLLKVYDVCIDIDSQIQMYAKDEVIIPSLPTRVKFQELFSIDLPSSRDQYQRDRLEGVNYLRRHGVIVEFEVLDDPFILSIYPEWRIRINVAKFEQFYKKIAKEFHRRHKLASSTEEIKVKANFDSITACLKIGDKKVCFQKESLRASLLNLLFESKKNLTKKWYWDEVMSKLGERKEDFPSKELKVKFYSAVDGIVKQVAKKTGINDFLLYDYQTLQVNPKYI